MMNWFILPIMVISSLISETSSSTSSDDLQPCFKSAESISHLQKDGLFPLGLHKPECSPEGLYMDRQCHASTGYCWCTDPKTGKEIQGTKKGPGEGMVACGQNSPSKSACQRLKHSQTTKINSEKSPLTGYFLVSCEDDGSFSDQQCHHSTGYCWCVDEDGFEIPGTVTAPGVSRTPCDARPKTCKEKAIVETNETDRRMMIGMYIPQCKPDGSYHKMQCWGATGECWCVTEKGKEIPSTKRGPGSASDLNCEGDESPSDDHVLDSSAAANKDNKNKSSAEDWHNERTALIAMLSVFGCLLVIVVVAMGIYFTKKRNEGTGSPRYSAVKEREETM